MKKIWILILGLALFACTQQKGYKIDVNLEGADGQLLLEQRGSGAWIPLDTVDFVNGTAVLEGEVEYPGDYYLSILGERAKIMVFLENSKITVTGKADSIFLAEINGSLTHDEYKSVDDQIKKISDEYMALYQQSREAVAAGDTAKAEELMEKVNEMYESTNTVQEDFIKNNPASYVSPFLLSRIQHGKDVEELDAMVNALDPKFNTLQSIITLKERITQLKTVAVGQIAPDFTQNDVDGNPVTFSDIYSQNELTLVDFWAAWCGPCRGENPNVVAVFNEYNAKGFTVFGVSLDREKDDWLKAIEDDKLTWTHVSDLAYWQNAAARLYAINSIPSSLLVDKTGKIVAKDKRGDELRATVAAFLDK